MPAPRRTPHRSAAVGWVGLVLGMLACGDESDGDERAARESWCGATCAAAERCGEGAGAGCVETCTQRTTGFFLRTTPDGLSAQAECVARAPECPDGIEGLLNTCAGEAWLDLPSTPTSERTCQAMAVPLFECGWFNSFEQCASFYGAFTKPALESWRTCDDISDCEGFAQCAEVTLYSYGD